MGWATRSAGISHRYLTRTARIGPLPGQVTETSLSSDSRRPVKTPARGGLTRVYWWVAVGCVVCLGGIPCAVFWSTRGAFSGSGGDYYRVRVGGDVDTGDGAVAAAGAWLVAADTRIADRYRLIERVGVDESGPVEFWLARDSVLARQVGATLVAGSEDAERSQWAASMVTALLRWGQFSHPGCPRILDVVGVGQGLDRRGLPDEISVVVVTDWAPGPTLVELLAGHRGQGGRPGDAEGGQPVQGTAFSAPMEAGAALGMVAPLAAAAEAAHGHGLLLGCYRPELLHLSQAGSRGAHVHLGFLLPDPARVPGDDVRGLGAVLYALLTGRWPLALAAAGIGAVVGTDGSSDPVPAAPHVLDARVPRALSELAMAALGLGGAGAGVKTAAALNRTVVALLDDGARPRPGGYGGPPERAVSALEDGQGAVRPGSAVEVSAPTVAVGRFGAGRTRVAVGAVAVVAAVGVFGVGPWHQDRGPLGPPIPAVVAPGAVAAAPGTAVVVSASVYDPTGQPDNPTQVWRALGTDPKAGWSTDTYLQPFPALKPGVGIMVGFAGPVQLTSLSVTSPSAGSEVQVRSASSPTSALADTTVLASTRLQAGETVVPLAQSQPVTHVLVWITRLGGGGDDNVTEISNLRFIRAAD